MKHINHLDYSKYCRNHVLGNVEKNLGLFLFQNLVTLIGITNQNALLQHSIAMLLQNVNATIKMYLPTTTEHNLDNLV